MRKLRPEISALLETGLLFLPAVPALIWLWPNLPGRWVDPVQALVYVYFFAGACWIGRKRWSRDALGLVSRGLVLGLVCGGVLIGEQFLAYAALGLPPAWRPIDLPSLLWDIFFYFALVGLVEELLFRGLIFRALLDWLGPAAAIFGSALAFALWHIGWAGPLIVAHFLIGIFWGLVRWRAGGILGLVFVHGLTDLIGVWIKTPAGITSLDRLLHIRIVHPAAGIAGDVLLVAVIVYLLWGDPRLHGKGRADA